MSKREENNGKKLPSRKTTKTCPKMDITMTNACPSRKITMTKRSPTEKTMSQQE